MHGLVAGVEVEHAGRRWRVHQPLGPDAVLLQDDAGAIVSADPIRVTFPDAAPPRPAPPVLADRSATSGPAGIRGRSSSFLGRSSSAAVLDGA
jgi:hypothetical protein